MDNFFLPKLDIVLESIKYVLCYIFQYFFLNQFFFSANICGYIYSSDTLIMGAFFNIHQLISSFFIPISRMAVLQHSAFHIIFFFNRWNISATSTGRPWLQNRPATVSSSREVKKIWWKPLPPLDQSLLPSPVGNLIMSNRLSKITKVVSFAEVN